MAGEINQFQDLDAGNLKPFIKISKCKKFAVLGKRPGYLKPNLMPSGSKA
jgi:hypothetical protein